MEEQYYENLEKCIAQEATKKGEVQIERAAEIARELKTEGLKRYEFCQMFEIRLNEEKMKKNN